MAAESTDGPLSPEDARVMIGGNEADVIDIREDESVFADGHVTGAVHMPDADPDSLPDDFSEDRVVIIVCESGDRSAELAESWRDDGRQVTSIEGGIDAWRNAGMPLQPRSEVEYDGPKLKPPGT